MEQNEYNWKKGETVFLPWNERPLKKSGSTVYAAIANSSYVCVREQTDNRRGILVKMMGKIPAQQILMVAGTPFCKDDRNDLISGKRYVSYPFPRVDELKEVLDIISQDNSLVRAIEKEFSHFNPSSTFWVRETVGRFLMPNKLQYYDVLAGQLSKSTDETPRYRLSLAYFFRDNLVW